MILYIELKKYVCVYLFLSLSFLLACTSNATEATDVDGVVSAWYSIPAYADNLLLSQKLPENQFKEKLKAKFNEICTDPLLERFQKWVDEASIYGTWFNEVFDSFRLIGPKKVINISKDTSGRVKATYRVTTKRWYSLNKLSTLDNFVSKFKVTNMSQRELEKLVNESSVSEIVPIEVTSTSEATFTLVKVNGRLKISEENEQLVSSTVVVHQL